MATVAKLEEQQNKLSAEKDAFLAQWRKKAKKVAADLDAARAEAAAASIVEGLSEAQRTAVATELAKTS